MAIASKFLDSLTREPTRFKFIREVVAELRKVAWPSWDDARNLTIIVIAVCLVMGLSLGLLDAIFNWTMNAVFLPAQ